MSLGTLYIVSAPSGAGKSSLIANLISNDPTHSVKVSISHTTRSPRPGENDGEHYHFVSVDEFKQLIQQDAFFEYAEVFGNFYGTSRLWIEQMLAQGTDVFLDIDWQGAQQIRKQHPAAKSIFILPPSKEELERRLNHRGQDSAETIQKRMTQARSEMSHFDEYDYLIINDDFKVALTNLHNILQAEKLKQDKQKHKYTNMLNKLLAQ